MHEIAEILGLRSHDLRRIIVAVVLILAILMFGVVGYSIFANLSLPDALYMTMITISTVGFAEIGEFDSRTRFFSTILIMVTLVWGAWALQSVLGTFLSPQFRMGMGQIRAVRKANRMDNHTIICGYGRIGRAVAAELARNGEQFLVLEQDEALVDGLRDKGWHIVQGDATEDHALLAAGVTKAKRLLAVLNTDNANIVTVLSARELNPKLWIASRVVQPDTEHKLRRAGANEVISPYDFGGRRLALTALRPHVAEFLSEVVFDEGRGAEMDEVPVLPGSTLVDRNLGDINLRRLYGVTVIALYHPGSAAHNQAKGFELNPGSDTILHTGDVLIVVGNSDQLIQVHRALGA